MINKPITNGRNTRWLLLLQKLNITILDKPRKENIVADFLSIIHNEDNSIPIDDIFIDENLFSISTKSPLCVDISNYLATRRLH